MNKYSQWGEEEHILKFFSGKPIGRYLDLGAFDGLHASNTRCLSDSGWHGVCVEACSRAFERLLDNTRTNEKVVCVNAAVTAHENQGIVLYHDAGDQIGTAYPSHHLGSLVKHKWFVGSVTPKDIAKVFGDRFEFVSVDIEGSDLPVIESLGPLLKYTQLICTEDTIPNCRFDQEYYNQLMSAWAAHGFTKVVGLTYAVTDDKPSNTLLARNE